MDLNKEQLENIIEGYQADFTDGFEQTRKAIYVEDVPMMIKEALALAEKSRWKYPDKGELPEDGEYVIVHPSYVSNNFPDEPRHILQYNDGRFQYSLGGSIHDVLTLYKVKAWTYAPVMEEG